MHFCIKCIFASNAFLQTKMLESGKMLCFLLCKKQRLCVALRCQNAFWHQMHFGIKCIFASNAFDATLTFCWCKNAFDAYILLHKMLQMHFCVHFPKENVQQTKMLESGKMHFGVHFPKENVQHHIFQRKMFSKTKCYKCI